GRCASSLLSALPCQCFKPAGNQTTSPGRISSISPPSVWAQPRPDVTIKVWPSGCVCHALRAPGANVTFPPLVRDGSCTGKSGSTCTEPVKCSTGPLIGCCEPLLAMLIERESCAETVGEASTCAAPV